MARIAKAPVETSTAPVGISSLPTPPRRGSDMPVIRKATDPDRPDWLKASAFGLFRVPKGNPAKFDLHYHDADEIWFIVEGRARILTEGVEHTVGPGDTVCTGMGDEHHILEVYEDLLGFYLEG